MSYIWAVTSVRIDSLCDLEIPVVSLFVKYEDAKAYYEKNRPVDMKWTQVNVYTYDDTEFTFESGGYCRGNERGAKRPMGIKIEKIKLQGT